MIERNGEDMWRYYGEEGHVVCVSTNGFVKDNGQAVMGRGCAKQATRVSLGIAKVLGDHIKRNGNRPAIIGVFESGDVGLGVLPVKHNWWEKADLDLIHLSVEWLLGEATLNPDTIYHIPRLGCGNGRLDWKEVKPLLSCLPDNVWVHSL